jgi:hypothetical protein
MSGAPLAKEVPAGRYWFVVTTVALLDTVEVFIVAWTFACVLRKARTARARALASFALPLA